MTTATRSRKGTKATATEATEATATEATDNPPTNLQEAIEKSTEAPSHVSADDVASTQIACFDRAIGRARSLAFAENRTTIDIGADLQEAIDAFKPLIPKADWWRQRADTINDYETRFRLKMNGRAARANAALNCYHVHALASDEAKEAIVNGMGGRPFPIATLETIGGWVVYTKADDSYAIKAGYETHFDALILRVADEGLTEAETTKAMNATEATVRLAQAEAAGGAKAKSTEAKAQATKATKDRTKAINSAVERFTKALASDAIGGASVAEVINKLAENGIGGATGLVDPATMTPTEALAFAERLCDLDRADVIYVMLQRFRAYETEANANAQSAGAPRPPLNDAPANGTANAA
jgi:hypothetical protein